MGNDIRVTGTLRIDPPLPWSKVRAIEERGGRPRIEHAEITLDETTVQTDEGTLHRKIGIGIEPRYPTSSGNGSSLTEELQQIVTRIGPGYCVSGYLECSDEEPGSLPWRVCVVDGVVREINPDVSWDMPEGYSE